VLDLQLSKWVTGLTKNGRKMIYLKASNHQYSDKIVVYDWADMDGEPSSSPAYIGSKARDSSTLAKNFDLSQTSTGPFASWRGHYFIFTVLQFDSQVS